MTTERGGRWETFGATATGFFVLVAHALLETARDALFLSNASAARLPWMYLALAFVGVSVSEIAVRTSGRLDARRVLIASQAIAVVGTIVLAFLVGTSVPFSYYVLYLWVGIASMSVLVRYWQHLAGCFTATRAKQLFPLIGTGSIAGALAGYALAATLSHTVGVAAAIPVAAAFFALSMLGPLFFFTAARGDGADDPSVARATLVDGLRAVVSHPYLRRVAAILVLASVTVTVADFVFKSVVAHEVAAADLGAFFARAYFAFNVASLLILVAAVNPIVRRLGVTGTLALLPVALFAGGVGVIATGGLAAAIALKSADGALRWSSHKTVVELLYVPMSSGLRDLVKGAMDVLAHRLGQVVGSVLILGALAATDSVRVPAALVGAFAALWIVLALTLKEDYLDLFRATLDHRRDGATLEFPELDVASLETLVAALNSPVDEKVVAAIDLLEQKRKAHLVPVLVLYHPSPTVVARSLDLFARTRRKDALPFISRLAQHEYAEVRAAALRASTALQPDESTLRKALESHCPVVNVTAIVGLTAAGWIPLEQGVEELLRHAETDSELARPMIARAIRYQPLSAFAPVLVRLASDPDPETRRQAVLAMQATKSSAFVPTLIRALAERALREDARDALVALGPSALGALEATLVDAATPMGLRIHLPRTIARFQTQRAADILVRHMLTERSGMVRYKVLRGLGRIVSNDPSLRLDAHGLDEVIVHTVTSLFQRLHWQAMLEAGAEERSARRMPGHELLLQLLRDKEALAIERLFRVLGLRYRGEDWADVYEGIDSDDPIARSSGRELLESVLPLDLGQAVVGLIDDAPLADRLDAGKGFYTPRPLAYEELVEMLAGEPGETVRLVARYHAVEIGLRADASGLLRPATDEPGRLERMRDLAARMQRDFPTVTAGADGHA